jgi:hypothetical protein
VCGACGTAVTSTLGAIGGKAAVAVATAGLVAAGASDIHRVTHHQAAPVTPVVQRVQPAATPTRDPIVLRDPTADKTHQPTGGTGTDKKPDSVTEPAGDLPSTPTDGGGTFADTPAPDTQTSSSGNGGSSAPTDPASQPLKGTEPVQVQGFRPPAQQTQTQPQTTTGPTSTTPADDAQPAGEP